MKNKNNRKVTRSISIALISSAIIAVSFQLHFYFKPTIINKPIIIEKPTGTININETKEAEDPTTIIINQYIENSSEVINKDEDETDKISEVGFTTETYVRLADTEDRTWYKSVNARVGDRVEFRIGYQNTSDKDQETVALRDVLPLNLKYVTGSVFIKNTTFPNGGHVLNDALVDNGIRIGGYAANGGNAYVYFTAEVINETLATGTNTLRNWGQAGVKETTIQDSADVIVNIPKEQK